MKSILLAAVKASENPTALWHWQGTPIMIGACLLVLLIASRTIAYPPRWPQNAARAFRPLV